MTVKPVYDDLYEALKDLNPSLPCGFKVRAYHNKKGEARAYVEAIHGIINDLDTIADRVEKVLPKYSVCIIRGSKIYLNLNYLSYRIKHEEGMKLNDRSGD